MTEEQIKEKVLAEYQKGNVCYRTVEGIFTAKMEQFVKQPIEGMLYDLNRDRATITAFLNDPKWVNDLALTEVLRYQDKRIKELEAELENAKK